MKVEISGVRVPITEQIDSFVKKKIKKIERYFKDIIFCHLILKNEKDRYEAEINLHIKGMTINGKEATSDLYASIERAIDKVTRQSKKYKEKKKNHKFTWHKGKVQTVSGEESKETPELEPPPVIEITRELAKPMGVDEAALQLRLSKNDFFIFLNAETNQVNVIYKKENGTFVLVQPE